MRWAGTTIRMCTRACGRRSRFELSPRPPARPKLTFLQKQQVLPSCHALGIIAEDIEAGLEHQPRETFSIDGRLIPLRQDFVRNVCEKQESRGVKILPLLLGDVSLDRIIGHRTLDGHEQESIRPENLMQFLQPKESPGQV